MIDFFLIARKFPRANQLWVDWCAARATARAWHSLVQNGRFHYQRIPDEWLFGSLLVFFGEHDIQMESTVIFDGGVIVAVFQRHKGKMGQFTRRGKPVVHEKTESAWSSAFFKAFEQMEKRIKLNEEYMTGTFSKDNPTRLLPSPHGLEDRPLDDGGAERDGHG